MRRSRLTVAICTHNQRQRLECTLHGLAVLQPPRCGWDLLIIDNASSDSTPELLASTAWRPVGIQTRVVREDQLGVSNARNRAVLEATGEYLIFIDDDETPDPCWLTTYEGFIEARRPDAMGGRIAAMLEDVPRPAWLREELLPFLGELDYGGAARRLTDHSTPLFTGNLAFRTDVFRRIGNFDPALGRKGARNEGGEDIAIYRRLIDSGCAVWWVPDALVHHRISAGKLRRSYFLDLHFNEGSMEGRFKRGAASRIPPLHLLGQLWRAWNKALAQRLFRGRNASLRLEMNVAFFIGYLYGWAFGKPHSAAPAGRR